MDFSQPGVQEWAWSVQPIYPSRIAAKKEEDVDSLRCAGDEFLLEPCPNTDQKAGETVHAFFARRKEENDQRILKEDEAARTHLVGRAQTCMNGWRRSRICNSADVLLDSG